MSNEVQRNNVNQVQVQSNTAPKARGRIVGKNNAEEVATNTNSTVNVSSALHSRGAAAAFLECKAGVALPTSSFKNYVGKQEAAIGSLYKSHENEYDKLLKKYEDLEDLLITLGKAKEDKIEKIRCEIGKLNNEIRKINLEVRRIYRKITSTICNVDSMAKAWRNSEKDSSLKKQGEEAINNFNRICTKYSSRESEKLQKQLKNSEEDIKDINEEIEMADEEIDGIEHILSFGSKNDRAVVDLQGYSREEVKEKGLLPYAKSKREISTKILKTLQKKEKSIGEKARAFEGDQNTIGKLAFDEVKSDATDVALTLELPDGATVNRGGNASDLLKELMNNAIARRGEIEGKIAETKMKYAWYGIGIV
ncbi:MAG: hypothetical protein LBB18_01555, partial [Puniceicoccales bacterium]|nr:hypothetical protein [Puniceicoccales bacterium]